MFEWLAARKCRKEAEAGDPGRITPEKKAASQTGMVSSSLRRRAQQNAAQRKVVGYGIDVSYWQGNIDWSKVKADGVTFAFIRVAYRTYGSSGTLNADTKAKQNITWTKLHTNYAKLYSLRG